MDLFVREAQPRDAEAIVAILNPIIETGLYTVFATPFTIEAERAYIESLPERGVFLVAVDKSREQGEEIVGFQSMELPNLICPAYSTGPAPARAVASR